MKWYKRDPDAALNGMRGLTHEEKSCYGTLIDLFYARDGEIPDDDWLLARHMECNPRTWRKVKVALFQKHKLTINSLGNLVPNRGEKTLNEARTYSETQANRARIGWETKKKNNKNNDSSMPPGNALTTTSTYKTRARAREGNLNFKDKGVDYRAPPAKKSDNVLLPIPERRIDAKCKVD